MPTTQRTPEQKARGRRLAIQRIARTLGCSKTWVRSNLSTLLAVERETKEKVRAQARKRMNGSVKTKAIEPPSAELTLAVPEPQPTTPIPKPNPLPVVLETRSDSQLLSAYHVITGLFYAGGYWRIDLSTTRLRYNVFGGERVGVDLAVKRAIQIARAHWCITTEGSGVSQRFNSLVARLRHNFGNPHSFEDMLRLASDQDNSLDPVDLTE